MNYVHFDLDWVGCLIGVSLSFMMISFGVAALLWVWYL